jgi:hypothetical protein
MYESKFNQMAQRYGMEGAALALVETFFNAGVAAHKDTVMQREIADAIRNAKVAVDIESWPEMKVLEWPEIGGVYKDHTNPLDPSDTNWLLKVLAGESTALQEVIKVGKSIQNIYWQGANPDTFEGRLNFESLNHTRKELKRARRHLTRLNSVIAKLKQSR